MKIPTRSNRIRIVAVTLAVFLPSMLLADTAPLTGDTYINPGDGNNYGTLPGINIGGTTNADGLLTFDLTKLPSGTTGVDAVSATLRIFVDKVTTSGSINIYAANAPWSENTVNGSTQPVPGAGNPVQTGIPVTLANVFIDVDVTAQVKAWLNGSPNDGFIITGTGSTSIVLDSKENASTSHPAELQIVLLGPTGPTGSTGATGATGPTDPWALRDPRAQPGLREQPVRPVQPVQRERPDQPGQPVLPGQPEALEQRVQRVRPVQQGLRAQPAPPDRPVLPAQREWPELPVLPDSPVQQDPPGQRGQPA